MKGGTHPLTVRIKGIVIGPTFKFDSSKVEFGTVSCGKQGEGEEGRGGGIIFTIYLKLIFLGFTVSREVILSNTSEIPMTFHLRVPDSCSFSGNESFSSFPNCNEFTIVPQTGTIPPNYQQVIQVSKI